MKKILAADQWNRRYGAPIKLILKWMLKLNVR